MWPSQPQAVPAAAKHRASSFPQLNITRINDAHLVLQLLELGADVSVQTSRPNSGTPLHDAVYQRHEAMVELLLQYGANPFVENFHSRTAMDLAVSSGNVAVIRALESKAIFHGGAASAGCCRHVGLCLWHLCGLLLQCCGLCAARPAAQKALQLPARLQHRCLHMRVHVRAHGCYRGAPTPASMALPPGVLAGQSPQTHIP